MGVRNVSPGLWYGPWACCSGYMCGLRCTSLNWGKKAYNTCCSQSVTHPGSDIRVYTCMECSVAAGIPSEWSSVTASHSRRDPPIPILSPLLYMRVSIHIFHFLKFIYLLVLPPFFMKVMTDSNTEYTCTHIIPHPLPVRLLFPLQNY